MGINNSAQDENAPKGVAKNPGLTPYATNVGSPVINPNEIDEWKGNQVKTIKNYFTEQLKELKEAYDEIVEDFNWNKIIYESELLFKPVMGKEYYFYQRLDNAQYGQPGSRFMSLIAPDGWNDMNGLSYIGTFKQTSTQKWTSVKLSEKYEEIK